MNFFLWPKIIDLKKKSLKKNLQIFKRDRADNKNRVKSKTIFPLNQKKKNISKPETICQQKFYRYNDQNKEPWKLKDKKILLKDKQIWQWRKLKINIILLYDTALLIWELNIELQMDFRLLR